MRILLIGININLTKKPMKPIIRNPINVANAIFRNSKKWTVQTKSKKKTQNSKIKEKKYPTSIIRFTTAGDKALAVFDELNQGASGIGLPNTLHIRHFTNRLAKKERRGKVNNSNFISILRN
jgi:hypothetical protein